MKKLFYAALAALLLASCGTTQEYVLMNDIEVPGHYPTPPRKELRIKNGDNVQVLIGHHDPTVVRLFNQLATAESQPGTNPQWGYTVSSTGSISMPIFDSVQVAGMTCKEVADLLAARLENEGIATGATVTVRITGFKVTVIGETGPGVFTFDDNGATIFDLMAQAQLAGSMGGDTRRDRILVMRQQDTVWSTDYINLLSTDILSSPYFYLQQNDVFYVYPTREAVWQSKKTFDYWMGRVTMFTSLLSLLTTLVIYNSVKK